MGSGARLHAFGNLESAIGGAVRIANFWVIATVLLAVAILSPLVALLAGLAGDGPYWDHVVSTVLRGYVINTLILVVCVPALSMVLALPPAWFISVFDFPGRGFFQWALVLPLAIPTYVAAFVYIQLPEDAIPLLIAIRDRWGVDAFQSAEIGIRYGVLTLLMAAVLYPYLYITARASFARQQRSVVEAAQTLGRTPGRVFFSVALPLARPGIVAGVSLIVMEVVSDYGAVNFFGVPTLTEGIFRTWFGLEDRVSGVRLAGLLVMAVLILLALERMQRGRSRYALKGGDGPPLIRRRASGWAAVLMIGACVVPLSIGLIFPVGQLIAWTIQTVANKTPAIEFSSAVRSLLLALTAAFLLNVVALTLSYTLRLYPLTWLSGLVRLASLGYATPGAAVAVGVMVLIGAIDRMDVLPTLVSGTVFAVVFAYLVRFLAVPLQSVTAGMTRICGTLNEASRTLGRGPAATLWSIDLPLLQVTLVASTMLVFVDILKELPLTMLLRPANFDTLAVTAFGMAKEGRIYECAVPSLVIVCAGGVGLVVLNRLISKPT